MTWKENEQRKLFGAQPSNSTSLLALLRGEATVGS